MRMIRIPQRFLIDHEERDLPTPEVYKVTKRHFWIDLDDPAVAELLDDARFYSHPDGPDLQPDGLANAARALVRALEQ